jgi:hypothetical protein
MKESKLIEMQKKIEVLGNLMQQTMHQIQNLKDLSIGTLETLKRVPGYQEALEDMKTDFLNKDKEEKVNVE